MKPPDTTPHEIVDRVVAELTRRKLVTPSLLLIELHRPLVGVMHAFGAVSLPFLVPLLGWQLYQDIQHVLSEPEFLDQLVCSLQQFQEATGEPN